MRIFCLCLALAFSVPVFGWGETGHEVVCEIAYRELTPTAREKVTELIETDPDYSSFAASCNWADDSAQKEKRRPEHFINVPRYYYEVRTGQCRLGDRCLFSAIRSDINTLSYSDDEQERLEALKYLGHWVGDIHQPLHVAYADDRGGNQIGLEDDHTCKYNLHSVWDTCIISKTFQEDSGSIATELLEKVDRAKRTDWNDTTVVDWAHESYDISRREPTGYCTRIGRACWYDSDNYRRNDGETKKAVVDDEYVRQAAPTVKCRLRKAGVRLGGLLNRILDPPETD